MPNLSELPFNKFRVVREVFAFYPRTNLMQHVSKHFLMKLNKELISEINILVKELYKNGTISEYKLMPGNRKKAIRFLKENDIIKPNLYKKFQYNSTNEINEIYKVGIESYLKVLNKSEWYNKNWVGYLIAFIVLLFTIYQHFDNRSLTHKFDSLNKQYDSLKLQSGIYEDSVYELKQELQKQKPELKKDTLPIY